MEKLPEKTEQVDFGAPPPPPRNKLFAIEIYNTTIMSIMQEFNKASVTEH